MDLALRVGDVRHVVQHVPGREMAECAQSKAIGHPIVPPATDKTLASLRIDLSKLVESSLNRIAEFRPFASLIPADIGREHRRLAKRSIPGLLQGAVTKHGTAPSFLMPPGLVKLPAD